MTRYRVILRGEGARPSGEWLGFYATRDLKASAEADAKTLAIAAIKAEWANGESSLKSISVVSCWRPKAWHARMTSGHTFFSNGAGADEEAWRLETEAAKAPQQVRASR